MGDDFFNMDNILSGDEAAALFMDNTDIEKEKQEPQPANEENNDKEPKSDKTDITEVSTSEELFGSNTPESVGSEEDKKEKEDTDSNEAVNSPKNFYSSITDALVEEGVFPDLDEERIQKVQSSEDFRNLIEERIQAELDDRQKRIDAALNAGVDTNIIKQYENTLSYLNNITPEMITEESEKGEDIRKRLLIQDFMNKNFSQEKAIKMVERLISTGEDVEEAKAALEENKKYFGDKYQEILDNAKAEEEAEKKKQQQQAEQLKKDILTSAKIFGDVEIDKSTRQKVYDNISRPIYKDPETGELYTAVQKYKKENENEFIKNVGLLFTLTDGFKDLSKLVGPSAKREVKKKMKELEHTLSNSARDKGGNLSFVGSTTQETSGKSFFDRGFTIDL